MGLLGANEERSCSGFRFKVGGKLESGETLISRSYFFRIENSCISGFLAQLIDIFLNHNGVRRSFKLFRHFFSEVK